MRTLLQLLILIWVIWLMYRLLKGPRGRQEDTAPGRKKVDSSVIEKDDRDPDCDPKS